MSEIFNYTPFIIGLAFTIGLIWFRLLCCVCCSRQAKLDCYHDFTPYSLGYYGCCCCWSVNVDTNNVCDDCKTNVKNNKDCVKTCCYYYVSCFCCCCCCHNCFKKNKTRTIEPTEPTKPTKPTNQQIPSVIVVSINQV
jgi:hypothetical protein